MLKHLKDKASRALGLDIDYLASSGSWTSLSFVIGTITGLATMVAFGNLLPREAYGTYNYLLSLGASLSFLTLTGVGPAVIRAVARGYEDIVSAALRLQLKYNSLAVLTVLVAALYYGYRGNTLFAASLVMLAVAYPLSEAFHIYKAVLTGQKRFSTLTKVTSITSLLGAAATIGVLFLTNNVLILVAIYTAVSLLPNIIVYRLVARELKQTQPEQEQIKEMRRTAFHFTGAGIIGVIASYVDRIVLFQVAGPAALAVYGFALAGPDRLKSLIKNSGSIALPRLAQKSLSQIRSVIYHRIGLALLSGLILATIYFFLAPLFFKIFLPLYLDAILYSQAMSIGIAAAPVSIYIGSIFASQNMLKAMYVLNFGNHIARIILFLTLGLLWQIWGLVLAFILSSVLNAVYSIIVWEVESRRLIKLQEHEQ